ncbi:hypothetical protein MCEMRE203_00423 [Candidatus Nanopelagicaceae bacterium]
MFGWVRRAAIDRELAEILDRHEQVRADGQAIRDYLLRVMADNQNGVEKFSDDALNRAAELIDQVGAGAFYWMTDIAAQMVDLSAASLRGFATNVSAELGPNATPEEIVALVVKVP